MVAALKAKVKKAKGKSEDEGQRASHQPSLMKDTLFAIRLFCLLPFYFCLPLRDGLLLLRPALLRAALLRPGFLAALLATLLRGRLVLLLAAARTALLAAARVDLFDETRTDVGVSLRRHHEHGLDARLLPTVHQSHLKLVLVIGDCAYAAHDGVGALLDGIAHQEALERVNAKPTVVALDERQDLFQNLAPLLYGEQSLLFGVDEDCDDYLVEELTAALDYVEVAVRHGVE